MAAGTRTLRSVAAERQRWTGLLLAVLVSVAFVTATLSLGALTRSTLERALDARFGGVDVVVRAAGGQEIGAGGAFRSNVDGSMLQRLAGAPGVDSAAGVIEGAATVLGRDGDPVPELFGSGTTVTNWIDDPDLAGADLVDGRAPTSADEVVLDAGTATDAGVGPGDEVTVDVPTASLRLRVVGVAGIERDGDVVAGPRLVWLEEEAVRSALGGEDGFDMAIARTSGRPDLAAVARTVRSDATVQSGRELVDERQASVRELAEFFDRPMMASAFIAVFVGAFVIFNTFSIVVAQRVREMALLRSVGATRRQVTVGILSEALTVGVIGSAVGVLAGWGVAVLARSAFSTALDLPDGSLSLSWTTVVAAGLTGVVATLVACVVPARRAGAVPPVAVLRAAGVDDTHRWSARHTAGVVVLVAGIALVTLVLTGVAELGLIAIGVGCAAVFVAFAMVGSAVVGRVIGALGRPVVAARGLTGRLAVRSAGRSPGRTTLVVVALSIGIAMVTVITTFEASVRAAAERRASGQLAGVDLVVESPVGVPRTVADGLREIDGVEAVTPIRLGVMTVLNSFDARQAQDRAIVEGVEPGSDAPPIGAPKFLTGVDLEAASRMIDVPGLRPRIDHLDDGEVMVLAKTAERAGWKVGDDVDVWFGTTGPATLKLVATFDARFGVDAEYVANLATTSDNAPPEFSGDSVVWAKVASGSRVDEVVAEARRRLEPLAPAARIRSVDDYLEDRLSGTTSLINLLVVLVAVSVVVAWVGVANTVAMALRERRTEITRLRALGLMRSQFHESAMWETLLVSLLGAALGIATGWAMGAGFILSFREEGLDPVIDPLSVVVIAVVGAAAAVVTAWYQARRVSGPVLPSGR